MIACPGCEVVSHFISPFSARIHGMSEEYSMRTLSAITFRINGPRRHQCTRHNGLEVDGTEIRPNRPRVLHVSAFTQFPTECREESPREKSIFYAKTATAQYKSH